MIIMLMKSGVGKDVKDYFDGEKPAIYSRRFVGSMVTALSIIATMFQIDIPEAVITQLTDNIWAIVSACGAMWGVLLSMWGAWKAKKEG
jgi:hypothetical protein